MSTDLHGNREDFEALARRFEAALSEGVDVHWALLGDLVHGPDQQSAARDPEVHGFPDESPALIDALFELRERHAGRIHFVLGNHDAGHVGFAHTSKFHADEVEVLEARLSPAQRARMQALFRDAMLLLLAPCGVLFAHGVPGDALTSLSLLDGELVPGSRAVNELLWSYGQTRATSDAMLARIGAEVGLSLHVAVHGHDRDVSGYFTDHGNQAQPVIFGAPRANKRYLWLDLAAQYRSTEGFVEGREVRRVYSD